MYYALNENRERIKAQKGLSGRCPMCMEKVIAKCGWINAHHWAHMPESKSGCVNTGRYEPETGWHRGIKSLFPEDCQEVVIDRRGSKRRADIKLENGLVLEAQFSPINPKEIIDRCLFHKTIAWVFSAYDAHERGQIEYSGFDILGEVENATGYYVWRDPKKSVLFAAMNDNPIFIDMSKERILELHTVNKLVIDTGNEERFGEWTRRMHYKGVATIHNSYQEFYNRIQQIDEFLLAGKPTPEPKKEAEVNLFT